MRSMNGTVSSINADDTAAEIRPNVTTVFFMGQSSSHREERHVHPAKSVAAWPAAVVIRSGEFERSEAEIMLLGDGSGQQTQRFPDLNRLGAPVHLEFRE